MKWISGTLVALLLLVGGSVCFYSMVQNPRVIAELRENPQGERAKKVMLLTLPSGKAIPINYLREGRTVYGAADFPWWRELRDGGGRGSIFIQGETFEGHIRAVEDDPGLRDSVFERLRPAAPRWAGTLIVIDLDEPPDP